MALVIAILWTIEQRTLVHGRMPDWPWSSQRPSEKLRERWLQTTSSKSPTRTLRMSRMDVYLRRVFSTGTWNLQEPPGCVFYPFFTLLEILEVAENVGRPISGGRSATTGATSRDPPKSKPLVALPGAMRHGDWCKKWRVLCPNPGIYNNINSHGKKWTWEGSSTNQTVRLISRRYLPVTLDILAACHCSICSMTAGAKRGVWSLGDESLAPTKASSVKAPTPAQLGFESELFWSNLKIQKDTERERERSFCIWLCPKTISYNFKHPLCDGLYSLLGTLPVSPLFSCLVPRSLPCRRPQCAKVSAVIILARVVYGEREREMCLNGVETPQMVKFE